MLSVVCSREILYRATVLVYLQGITAKDFYYSYVEKHRSCWELVGNLLRSEVPVGRFSIVTGLVVFDGVLDKNQVQ
jgi:hypothetical protein